MGSTRQPTILLHLFVIELSFLGKRNDVLRAYRLKAEFLDAENNCLITLNGTWTILFRIHVDSASLARSVLEHSLLLQLALAHSSQQHNNWHYDL